MDLEVIMVSEVVKVLVAQQCAALCDPVDCSPPGSFVHRIPQARILEWVAITFSRVIFLTQGTNLHLFAGRNFTESPGRKKDKHHMISLICGI